MRVSWPFCAIILAMVLDAAAQQPTAAELFAMPDKGHCSACHQLPAGIAPASRADLGPPLSGARMRELGKPRMRALLDDPMTENPDTVMPPFGRHRILDAAEIDRLVEFLHALP
ncbi:MAG TPA: c-type cytochrome [Usitatibacter sp.]|nr:c-type cytochrome [Usitatibacter sp.]